MRLQLIGKLLRLVVDSLQDDRGGSLALRVCLGLDRVYVGGAGCGDRGDGLSEWAQVLCDRDNDLSKPPHCFGCLVQERGGQEFCVLGGVHEQASTLDVVLGAGHVPPSFAAVALLRLIDPAVNGLARLPLKALVFLEVGHTRAHDPHSLDDRGVFGVVVAELAGFLDALNELHEAVVHGAAHHGLSPIVRFGLELSLCVLGGRAVSARRRCRIGTRC